MPRTNMKITTRRWRSEDIPGIIECSRAAYHDYAEEYIFTPRHYEMQLAAFPQGQFVALLNEKVVGYATSLIVILDEVKKKISAVFPKIQARRVRVCAAQYHMQTIKSFADLERSVEFFADTADSYHSHFLLLPEYFTYQLLSFKKRLTMHETTIELSGYAERYIKMFQRLARKYNLYIIGGSHPICREGKYYNTAHLFSPTGNVYTQEKLHITPAERNQAGINYNWARVKLKKLTGVNHD